MNTPVPAALTNVEKNELSPARSSAKRATASGALLATATGISAATRADTNRLALGIDRTGRVVSAPIRAFSIAPGEIRAVVVKIAH